MNTSTKQTNRRNRIVSMLRAEGFILDEQSTDGTWQMWRNGTDMMVGCVWSPQPEDPPPPPITAHGAKRRRKADQAVES